jgi:hypothetical protein
MHTAEGQARQKKKENRMFNEQRKRGLVLDQREQSISLHCIGGTVARPDYVQQSARFVGLHECQENEHTDYGVSCETKRLTDIYAVLQMSGETRNIVFFWVNPDPFTIDGLRYKADYAKLMDTVYDYATNPEKEPTTPLSLLVFNYSMRQGRLAIFDDPDFPEHLKPLVRSVTVKGDMVGKSRKKKKVQPKSDPQQPDLRPMLAKPQEEQKMDVLEDKADPPPPSEVKQQQQQQQQQQPERRKPRLCYVCTTLVACPFLARINGNVCRGCLGIACDKCLNARHGKCSIE